MLPLRLAVVDCPFFRWQEIGNFKVSIFKIQNLSDVPYVLFDIISQTSEVRQAILSQAYSEANQVGQE